MLVAIDCLSVARKNAVSYCTRRRSPPTILAKIMWDKLAECTASIIDQFFTWKQTFFGLNTTSPPPPPPPLPPCNVVHKERLAEESSNIASGGGGGGGEGGASEYCRNSGKRHSVSHILARIVVLFRATIRAKTVETELSEHYSYPLPLFVETTRSNYAV